MRQRLALFCLLSVVSGCGLFRESEPPPPKVHKAIEGADCELPKPSEFSRAGLSVDLIQRTADCLDKNLDSAFGRVHGATPDELTLGELRVLYRSGLLRPNESYRAYLDDDDLWEIAGRVISAIHPSGRQALSRPTLKRLLQWARTHAELAVQIVKSDSPRDAVTLLNRDSCIDSAHELIQFLSPQFSLSLSDAKELLNRGIRSYERHGGRDRFDPHTLQGQLEAAWISGSLVLEDTSDLGVRRNLSGESVRSLLFTVIETAKRSHRTFAWGIDQFLPQRIPDDIALEWATIARIWQRYFSERRFSAVDTQLVAWSLQKLVPDSRLDELSADLVRASQRLSPAHRDHGGLHPIFLQRVLEFAETAARDLKVAAKAFGECSRSYTCRMTWRTALQHPLIRRVAVKGTRDAWWDSAPPKKRLDNALSWPVAAARLVERALMSKVFEAFDTNGDGIPLDGRTTEDLNETFDLAFTFLRFVAIGGAQQDRPREQRVPNLILVKPGAIYRVMGLIGDRWMPDGNGDGILDAEEFFSIVKVYGEIHDNSNYALWSIPNLTSYYPASSATTFSYREQVYPRAGLIRGLKDAYARTYPDMHRALGALGESTAQSLFHAIVGNSPQRPLEAISYVGTPPRTIRYYVKPDAMLGPTALVVLLDRLMLRCDTDEDERLSWSELDCALPLILDGSLQTLTSGLLEIDPGPHDVARFLLTFLRANGVPISLAKLLLINGSVRELRVGPAFDEVLRWADTDLSLNWSQIADFIGAPDAVSQRSFWRLEAERRFRHCDHSPRDGQIRGRIELDCLTDTVFTQIEESMAGIVGEIMGRQGQQQIREWRESPVIRLAVKLSTVADRDPTVSLSRLPLFSTPSDIFRLLEEIIRRSVPLWQMRD